MDAFFLIWWTKDNDTLKNFRLLITTAFDYKYYPYSMTGNCAINKPEITSQKNWYSKLGNFGIYGQR